jgi:hypothetical protein
LQLTPSMRKKRTAYFFFPLLYLPCTTTMIDYPHVRTYSQCEHQPDALTRRKTYWNTQYFIPRIIHL